MFLQKTKKHWHIDDYSGFAYVCYHSCKALITNWQFWLGLTLGFPIEHFLWVKVWPLSLLTFWSGL